MIYYVIGVSGSGKTTIGELLAKDMGVPFFDADDFHPPENIDKMSRGEALTDTDREGWLEAIHRKALDLINVGESAVITCSALKEKYRVHLSENTATSVRWIYLHGDFDLIKKRMQGREHFMPPSLLQSQFEALEKPTYGLEVSIDSTPEKIVKEIKTKLMSDTNLKEFGLIGMGVMGTSLARNLARNGFKLALYNRYEKGVEEQVAQQAIDEHTELSDALGFEDMKLFVEAQSMPRKIFMMVKAGKVTDIVINSVVPFLSEGDILIDGGNSHYTDTERRIKELKEKGLHFIGTGVSGGERGALEGPSIMPSGDAEAYKIIQPYFDKIAAKDKNGDPCCTYVGRGGSGHFIKMVHNGIEYAEMQLIAEAYALMRYVYGHSLEEIADEFTTWLSKGLSSYLLEISIKILRQQEQGHYLIDLILDKAGNKGTGSWTTIAAAEYGVPSTLITSALFARYISAFDKKRDAYSEHFGLAVEKQKDLPTLTELRDAYGVARLVNHEQGFELMHQTSQVMNWDLNLSEIARIWTNGCIIRSELMEKLIEDFKKGFELITKDSRKEMVINGLAAIRNVTAAGTKAGVSIPCLLSGVDYLNANLYNIPTANMIQAQRDFFGAHTFQRVGDATGKSYHFEWEDLG